jgi:hypothetical protein
MTFSAVRLVVSLRFSPQATQNAEKQVFNLAACLREAASAKAGARPPNKKDSVLRYRAVMAAIPIKSFDLIPEGMSFCSNRRLLSEP